jgi:hypothetical protein
MMCPAIDNPNSCEILYVFRFLHAKNTSVGEIHRELCAVNRKDVMHEGTVAWGVQRWAGELMVTTQSEMVSYLQ